MSDNNICPSSVFNDYFSGLNIIDALTLSNLFRHRVYKDSDGSVSICLCHPTDDVRSETLCKVLRDLRDVASSMNFRFVFYVHTDDANFGISMDIFRISMSLSFHMLVSERMVGFKMSHGN